MSHSYFVTIHPVLNIKNGKRYPTAAISLDYEFLGIVVDFLATIGYNANNIAIRLPFGNLLTGLDYGS